MRNNAGKSNILNALDLLLGPLLVDEQELEPVVAALADAGTPPYERSSASRPPSAISTAPLAACIARRTRRLRATASITRT